MNVQGTFAVVVVDDHVIQVIVHVSAIATDVFGRADDGRIDVGGHVHRMNVQGTFAVVVVDDHVIQVIVHVSAIATDVFGRADDGRIRHFAYDDLLRGDR